MMRKSAADLTRASYAASSQNHANSAASQARMLEKKKELDIVMGLERTSQVFIDRLEALSKDFDVMADAGQVFGLVSEQWPRMFQILQLFLASRAAEEEQAETEAEVTGCKLVRVPADDLQEAASEDQT